jgi:hypothetical protein
MNELDRFDYGDLEPGIAEFARECAERIHELARLTAASIAEIGRNLTEVKERVGHGKFLEWLDREFAWTPRQAQRFMNVHANVKCDNLSDLPIDASALYLIAAPNTSESVRADLLRLAESGEHVSHAIARAAIDGSRTKEALAACEAGIEPWIHAGKALVKIRDERLYSKSHETFEDYCRERWADRPGFAELLEMVENGFDPAYPG